MMIDRETVIEALGCIVGQKRSCEGCPYSIAVTPDLGGFSYGYCAKSNVVKDAIALLKEHEKPDCEHAEHDGIGCLGYAGCTQDDEPIDICKVCRKYTGNRYEEVSSE